MGEDGTTKSLLLQGDTGVPIDLDLVKRDMILLGPAFSSKISLTVCLVVELPDAVVFTA